MAFHRLAMVISSVCMVLGAGEAWARSKPWPSEEAQMTFAPEVPLPIVRRKPAVIRVHLEATEEVHELGPGVQYRFWGFNGRVPGPMIRARVGDVLEVRVTSAEPEMPHNIDFHAVGGTGGGATVLTV